MKPDQDLQAENSQWRLQLAEAFAARLATALNSHPGIPQQGRGRVEAVANLLGLSTSTTQRMLAGSALPEIYRLADIARRLNVTSDFLLGLASEEESDRMLRQRAGLPSALNEDQYLAIPILNPQEGPGADRFIYAGRKRIGRFIQPVESAAAIMMQGESMAPTVLDGEMMIIARLPHTGGVLPEGLYPLRCRNRPDWTLRRIQPIAGGRYLLSCDNPHYKSFEVEHEAITEHGDDEWEVAGRLRTILKRY